MRNSSKSPTSQTGEANTRARPPLWLLVFVLFVGLIVALFSVFKLPIGLLLILMPGALVVIWLLVKFVRDNNRLARWVGWKRLIGGALMTGLVFVPVFVLLIPGFILGNYVAKEANDAIERLQAWSAPDILSKEIKQKIEERVEREVKRNLPWYYKPLIWTGQVKDYEKIVTNEVRIVTETIQRAQPKPVHIRATAGFVKTLLLFISLYSTAWVVVLMLRSLASLFGRIVVASDPPIHFDMRPGRYPARQKLPSDFSNSLKVGSILELYLDPSEKLLVRRAHEPSNAVPSTSMRIWGGALMMRLRRNLVFLSKIQPDRNSSNIRFQAHGGSRYVSATLGEKQFVVVSPSHLVGFSDTVRFSSHYDFNLAMLSMRRAVSMVACGPGRLILSVPGDPDIHERASQTPRVYMDKLLLFGMDTKFEIRAAKGLLDYYTSGCVVRPLKGNLFVCDPANPPAPGMIAVLWKLIKQVYLPI